MSVRISKFNILLIIVVIINLLQALLTPIIEDESYYLKFSENLDWGFFDHPPMVGVIIFLNRLVFSGILGVRFLTIILMALTIKITWSLIPNINKKHVYSELIFFGIFLSIPIFSIYGFITTADIALLFFGSIYLFVFKRFKDNPSILNTILLGLVSALLMYSKYHGGILILISILINVKLLKELKLYVAGLISLIFLAPHIGWLFQHDFIILKYHFYDRSEVGVNLLNIVDYIVGATIVLNPIFLFLILWNIKAKKIVLSKDLKFYVNIMVGYLLFFLINSFRLKMETHWVAFAMIPIVIVIHSLITSSIISLKNSKIIMFASILVIFTIRILVTIDLPINTEFHKEGHEYYSNIDRELGDQNIAFMNSYQLAAKYSFYTGKDAYSLNNSYYRKNQYDFWDYATKLHNKDVYVISNWPSKLYDSIKFSNGEAILGKNISNFQMFSNITIDLKNSIDTLQTSKDYDLLLGINNPYPYDINLDMKKLKYKIALQIRKGDFRKFIPIRVSADKLNANSIQDFNARIRVGKHIPSGQYKCTFVMSSNSLPYQVVTENIIKQIILNVDNP